MHVKQTHEYHQFLTMKCSAQEDGPRKAPVVSTYSSSTTQHFLNRPGAIDGSAQLAIEAAREADGLEIHQQHLMHTAMDLLRTDQTEINQSFYYSRSNNNCWKILVHWSFFFLFGEHMFANGV